MNTGEIIIYQNPEGNIKIDVRLEDESVWLTQEQIALLFGKSRTTITEHIQHVFNEGELNEKVVCREFRHTTQHGAIQGKTQEKLGQPCMHFPTAGKTWIISSFFHNGDSGWPESSGKVLNCFNEYYGPICTTKKSDC